MSDKIESLKDFISEIENFPVGSWYYRGESKDYGKSKNLASGYRWMQENQKAFIDLINLRVEFFREVGGNLSDKEVENFLAYSQHHGLPTELLDITTNPMVALYFACESNPEDDGYLYYFNNTVVNSMDPEHGKRQFQYSPYRDLTIKLFSKDISNQKIWFRWSDNIDENHLQKERMLEENQYVYELYHGSDMYHIQTENEAAWEKLVSENPNNKLIYRSIGEKISAFNNDAESIDKRMEQQIESIIGASFDLINATKGQYFPSLRYLLIRPTIIFDRMKNQQGAFIYQLNTSTGFDKGYFQPIVPAHTTVIPAKFKTSILKQLDQIGINKKFLYSDDDSVAEYLKQHYSGSIYELMNPFGDI